MATQPTGKFLTNTLERQSWIKSNLLQAATRSFWTPYTGKTMDSIVYQSGTMDSTIANFDYDSYIAIEAVEGDELAFGKGVNKMRFNNTLTLKEFRFPVRNGTKFDGLKYDDMTLDQHSDSIKKAADGFVKWKDQSITDALQGTLGGVAPSHIVRPANRANIDALTSADTMSYDLIMTLNEIVKSGEGFTSGGKRAPLSPFKIQNDDDCYLLIIDQRQLRQLRADTNFLTNNANAGERGDKNPIYTGIVGQIGSIYIKAMKTNFFGSGTGATLKDKKVEHHGMRTFSGSTRTASRAMLLGAGAVQFGFGKMPEYKLQTWDFEKQSESCLETFCNVQKTRLITDSGDYTEAKVAGIDFGVVAVETYHS